MNIVLYLLAFGSFASLILTTVQGRGTENAPEITSNTTTADVNDDDIAFFTCSARGHPTPSIRWLRAGEELASSHKGVKILSIASSPRLVDSHLFVAVTSSSARGDYVCEATNEVGQAETTFVIEGSSGEQETAINKIAIGLALGLSCLIFGSMAFFITRAQWRLKIRGRSGTAVHDDKSTPNGAPANHLHPEEDQAKVPSEESFPTEETAMIHTTRV